MTQIVVGVDPSLTATGIMMLGYEGRLVKSKSIPKGSPKFQKKETLRLMGIVKDITKHLPNTTDLVAIEGLAFMARNSTALVQLAGLNYMLRAYLVSNGIPFVIVPPTSLKKFISGKGNCKKDLMFLETYKRYDVSFTDDNICDAFGLAKVAEALLLEDKSGLPQFQQEVLASLTPQI